MFEFTQSLNLYSIIADQNIKSCLWSHHLNVGIAWEFFKTLFEAAFLTEK